MAGLMVVVASLLLASVSGASVNTATTDPCKQDRDGAECFKLQVLDVVDEVLGKDEYQISDSIRLVKNDATAEKEHGDRSFLDSVSEFVHTHDIMLGLPGGSSAVISPRNLDLGEFSVKLNMDASEGRRRKIKKHKLKKILVPIAIFLILKSLTLIPLFLSILGIKAWNALQLGFGSFVVSLALAVFNLTKKLAGDSQPTFAPAPIVAHHPTGWDKRSESMLEENAHTLAYNAYQPQ